MSLWKGLSQSRLVPFKVLSYFIAPAITCGPVSATYLSALALTQQRWWHTQAGTENLPAVIQENLCPATKRNILVSKTSTMERAYYYTWTLFFPCSSKLPGSYEKYLFTNCPRTLGKTVPCKRGLKSDGLQCCLEWQRQSPEPDEIVEKE